MNLNVLRNKPGLRISAVALTAAIGLGSMAGAASASTTVAARPRPVAVRQAQCDTLILWRQIVLTATQTRVDGVKRLTADQKAGIDAEITTALTNLTTVNKPAVDSATTLAAVNAACQAIFTDNRVFAVVVPQSDLIAKGDVMGSFHDSFAQRSAALAAAGKDTTAIDASLASAETKITAAQGQVTDATVDLYNSNPGQVEAIFANVRSNLFGALVDLRSAREGLVALGG